jgi:hypothetical protein
MLDRVCKRHGLPEIEFDNVDLMAIYGEYNGEKSGRGGYTWHKLTAAYQDIVGKPLEGAHDAMADVQAMIEIVEDLQRPF